ncbi:hypothetical protein ACFW31_19190 [Nocardiopsis alba]|uniref:hypothetical protein n=1 Tax=Nocardiopsis alba TaxID=53437 RepID=UPI00366AC35C
MFSKYFKIFTLSVTAFSTLAYTSLPASALPKEDEMTAPSPPDCVANMEEAAEAQPLAQPVVGDEAEEYAAQARDAVSVTGTHLREGESADFEQPEVARLEDGTTLVIFPLTGGDLTDSALTVSIASDDTTGQVHEMLLREISPTSGSVEFWVDGVNHVDQVVEAGDEGQVSTQGFSDFIDCLNNQGASGWLVAAISLACSAVCVGTVGAGCIPCITAAAGVTGGVVGFCIRRAF